MKWYSIPSLSWHFRDRVVSIGHMQARKDHYLVCECIYDNVKVNLSNTESATLISKGKV